VVVRTSKKQSVSVAFSICFANALLHSSAKIQTNFYTSAKVGIFFENSLLVIEI
jgi:hypothetical protein